MMVQSEVTPVEHRCDAFRWSVGPWLGVLDRLIVEGDNTLDSGTIGRRL